MNRNHAVGTKTRHATCAQHLEGQGDLVSRLMTPITHMITLVILITKSLTKSP